MKNKWDLAFCVLLVTGFVVMACDTGNNTPETTGIFQLKITELPQDALEAMDTTNTDEDNGFFVGIWNIGGNDCLSARLVRNGNVNTDETRDENSFTCYLYDSNNRNQKYIGSNGNYDIRITYDNFATIQSLPNQRLEVNKLNTFSYNSFQQD
jgi:hypothetical protein